MTASSVPTKARAVCLRELMIALAAYEPVLIGDADTTVTDVRHDSREVRPGELYVARSGSRSDGVDFCSDAVARGAAAVITGRTTNSSPPVVARIEVTDPAAALAVAAETVHGRPSGALDVVGVTGTNGKTTVAWLLQKTLERAGESAARIGTLGYSFDGVETDGKLTTPESDDVSRYARQVLERGGRYLVMEASSHALVQRRVEGLKFSVALFTNLTQDHLDFHGTMEAYGEAKRRLFVELAPKAAVINVDDAFGAVLAAETVAKRVLRVSRSPDSHAEVRPVDLTADARGMRGSISLPSGRIAIETRLVGEHNLDNILLVLGAAEALGIDLKCFANALGDVAAAPGRLERCDGTGDDIVVLVDYCHTPDALVRALGAVRELTTGQVHCVFGCGGDRDSGKRPLMGAAVGRFADFAYLTNDNPRNEEPSAIAADVEPALVAANIPYVVELDRARAIEKAVTMANAGDVVLVAGKGHETYQILGPRTIHFDDREECRRALALRRGAR